MFFYLMKFAGLTDPVPLAAERLKGVVQNTNPANAGITAALLMQTHALFGLDTCRCIISSAIPEEAQHVAVMMYEYYQKL